MKAQVSIEYIMVALIIAALVIPTAYLVLTFSKSSEREIKGSQINKIGNDMVKTAEKVYYQGYPSRITIDAAFPSGITNVTISKDWDLRQNEVVFKTYIDSKSAEFSFPSKVNIAGYFPPESFSEGQKSIRIEAIDNTTPYVLISIK